MLAYESAAYNQGFSVICGLDEAGRGPLAGPVFAAGCILPKGFFHPEINDSKQLSHNARVRLYRELQSHRGVLLSFSAVGVEDIDQINIFEAVKLAMRRAISALTQPPDILFVDGFQLDKVAIPVKKIIKGDSLSLSIAAASIVAKVERDLYMEKVAEEYPGWGFEKHKGYGTKNHIENLYKWGPLPGIHRYSFEPIKSMII